MQNSIIQCGASRDDLVPTHAVREGGEGGRWVVTVGFGASRQCGRAASYQGEQKEYESDAR